MLAKISQYRFENCFHVVSTALFDFGLIWKKASHHPFNKAAGHLLGNSWVVLYSVCSKIQLLHKFCRCSGGLHSLLVSQSHRDRFFISFRNPTMRKTIANKWIVIFLIFWVLRKMHSEPFFRFLLPIKVAAATAQVESFETVVWTPNNVLLSWISWAATLMVLVLKRRHTASFNADARD